MNRVHKIKSQVVTFFILSLFLHGCAYTPDNWAFDEEVLDKEALTKVKRVALLDMPPPSKIWLGDPGGGGGAALFFLGPVLALAADAHSSDNPASGAFFSETTQKELKNWLEQAGMEVILLKAKRGEQPKFLHDYSQFEQVDADVILEVVPIFTGFRHDTSTMGFTKGKLSPEVSYAFRVVSAKNKDLLVESNVFHSSFYHYQKHYIAGVKLIGPKEHLFEDEEAVNEQPEEALRRLQYAIKEATKTIAQVVTNTSPPISFVKPSGELNLSGTYIAKITRELRPAYDTGSTNKYYCFNQKRTFSLELKQVGGTFIKGYFLSGHGTIQGNVFGSSLVFTFSTSRCPSLKRGRWALNSDGLTMEGYGWKQVKWKLQKTR